MLKTLKFAGYLAVLLAICGIGAFIVVGVKGDPEVREYLDQPSFTKQLKDRFKGEDKQKEKVAPLVSQAKALALRFDPPPPPKPPKSKVKTTPEKAVARNVPKPPPPKPVPGPKVQKSVKFDLLATVVHESVPDKSLALLKTTGNKQEWFRQGEKLGHHEIKEIRDGSVIFTQSGRKPQELFVPAKPQVKSILKDDISANAAKRRGPGSITIQQDQPGSTTTAPAAKGQVSDSGKVRVARPAGTASKQRPVVSSRSQRVRTVPKQTVEEQKESIESSIGGIKEILSNLGEEDVPDAEKQEQQESFKLLIEMLNAENKRLEEEARKEAVGREKPASEDAKKNQDDKKSDETAKKDTEKTK